MAHWTPARLAALPRRGGFRLRGVEIGRLETLVYSAFAFALTLLVVSVGAPPTDFEALTAAMQLVPAFGVSFVLLAVFWRAYAQWCRRFGMEDGLALVLGLALIFTVLVFVYPLRAMSIAGLSWLTGGGLPSEFVLHNWNDMGGLFIVYGAAYACLSSLIAAHYGLSLHAAEALGLDAAEQQIARAERSLWLQHAAVGLLSALSAWLLPSVWKSLAPWFYMLLIGSGMLYARRVAPLVD